MPIILRIRLQRGKEHAERYIEKLGFYDHLFYEKKEYTVHIHGASVGETLSALPIIDALQEHNSNINFVITSITKTSSEILSRKLPDKAIHIFAPLDTPKIVKSFFSKIQPDITLIIDSEIWPNFLIQAKQNKIPVFGLNMRFSVRSQKLWLLFKKDFKNLMSAYKGFFVQNDTTARFIRKVSDKTLRICSNLKWGQKPLDLSDKQLAYEKNKFSKDKKIIVLLSTHYNEELLLSKAIYKIKNVHIIIVPRHPNRNHSIQDALQKNNISSVLRSNNEYPTDKQIYIADTLGEVALWAKIADIIVMGKTFDEIGGGHNIIEAALYNNAIICGPKMFNFTEVLSVFTNKNAIINVQSPRECADRINQLLSSPHSIEEYADKAKKLCTTHHDKALAFLYDLKQYLPQND